MIDQCVAAGFGSLKPSAPPTNTPTRPHTVPSLDSPAGLYDAGSDKPSPKSRSEGPKPFLPRLKSMKVPVCTSSEVVRTQRKKGGSLPVLEETLRQCPWLTLLDLPCLARQLCEAEPQDTQVANSLAGLGAFPFLRRWGRSGSSVPPLHSPRRAPRGSPRSARGGATTPEESPQSPPPGGGPDCHRRRRPALWSSTRSKFLRAR